VYGQLFSVFLSALYHALDAIPNLKQGEVGPFLSVLEHVRDSGLLERFDVDISARLLDIETRIRELSAENILAKFEDLKGQADANFALPLLFLSDEIENNAKKLDKRFPEPLLGYTISSRSLLFASHIATGRLISSRWLLGSKFLSSLDKSSRTGHACSRAQ
jgi:hypothetical protein